MSLLYTRYQFLELIRNPVTLMAIAIGPVAGMLFFVLPNASDNPRVALLASGSMLVFGAFITVLAYLGIVLAESRATAWDPYVRSLPAGPVPQFVGYLANSLALVVLLAIVPIGLLALLFTTANPSPGRILVTLGALVLAVVPFTCIGLLVNYGVPAKAAAGTTNAVMLPLAFAGGLFGNPTDLGGFIGTISPFVPTRGAADLVWASLDPAYEINGTALVMLVIWTVLLGPAAVAVYRRNQKQRYT